ncbi:MAG: WYL domain-containing protein [Chloroflexi bacterium]|nr:WYL domain-containing protein [Chloroflexota bacterium]
MDDRDRFEGKRDRVARMLRIVRYLEERGESGARPDEIARAVAMSRRTVYRDLRAIERELELPLWSMNGIWGLAERGLLPPLKLTLDEAMAVFLAARLIARYATSHDPDLMGAFQKLGSGLPEALAEHVATTLDVMARQPPDDRLRARVRTLTRAWAERRVVSITYDPGTYDPGRELRVARVRPYLIEPSSTTHSLYLIGHDETRAALRTFKIERILDVAMTNDRFEPPAGGAIEDALAHAWDIIADQPAVEVVLRFAPSVAGRVAETRWHPSERREPAADGSLVWRATVAGVLEVRLWVLSWGADVEVLEPADLRREVARTIRAAAARYAGDGPD